MNNKDKQDKDAKNMNKINDKKQDKNKGDEKMENVIERKKMCTPIDSLKQSFEEVKSMQEGKIEKQTWEDFVKELEDENREE